MQIPTSESFPGNLILHSRFCHICSAQQNETEAQRGGVIGPRPHSQEMPGGGGGTRLRLQSSFKGVHPLTGYIPFPLYSRKCWFRDPCAPPVNHSLQPFSLHFWEELPAQDRAALSNSPGVRLSRQKLGRQKIMSKSFGKCSATLRGKMVTEIYFFQNK